MNAVVPPADTGVLAAGLSDGLAAADVARLESALQYARQHYQDRRLGTGEAPLEHGLGMAGVMSDLRLDADARMAALLFAIPGFTTLDPPATQAELAGRFGPVVASLVDGITRLNSLRVVTRSASGEARSGGKGAASQAEVLRKMLLAMVEDIRVVLLRLASRVQTLRYLTTQSGGDAEAIARETLDIYAPLANRLGVWQVKWELEDLSFRFIEPEAYRRIAAMLDERRGERESYISEAAALLRREIEATGLRAEISGRPKHIYSIWNKMRQKSLAFEDLYDVRALRVLVDDVKDCYTALGVVHNLWQPIPREFDDYISRPKGNFYRSLHTAVVGPDGRALEVQIRTHEMHRHAELGVAAHWRYKEGARGGDAFDEKIAFLRQMLAWRDDIVDSADWVEQSKQAALDDTIYVLTPQGRVIDLPRGATPVDFAYTLHTSVGHRCRGAKVNGRIVPLDYRLGNGERVEILTAKTGGPSRDWLNASLGYIRSSRARNKVRQWFNGLALEQQVVDGRAIVERELQREGRTGANLEALAQSLGFDSPDALFAACAREEVGSRQLQLALGAEPEAPRAVEELMARKSRADTAGGILVVGVDRLMTQLAKCCRPVPPDDIAGFITRGRGVSIHRRNCPSLKDLLQRLPERAIEAAWGPAGDRVYSVEIMVRSHDRPGLLKDISEVLSREHINVTAVNTLSRGHLATMAFTVEVKDTVQLARTLSTIAEVPGVASALRR
jgi:GTP pyrophosphokinase